MNTEKTGSPRNCPLLALPREIRDQIYGLGFEERLYGASDGRNRLILSYHDPLPIWRSVRSPSQIARLPLWLFACRQTLFEGLEIFYRHAVCIGLFRHTTGHTDASGLFSLAKVRKIDLIDACGYHGIKIERQKRRNVNPDSQGIERMLTLDLSPKNILSQVICSLQSPEAGVKELTLKFGFPRNFLPRFRELSWVWQADFSILLDIAPSLDRVEFAIARPLLQFHFSSSEVIDIFYVPVQKELERVAKRLVSRNRGNDSEPSNYVVRDWHEIGFIHEHGEYMEWHFECCYDPRSLGKGQLQYLGSEWVL